MVRNFGKKTDRGKTPATVMLTAVRSVKKTGLSIRAAAHENNINYRTLARYCKKISQNEIDDMNRVQPSIPVGYSSNRKIFSMENESELADYIVQASEACHSLTPKIIKTLAYSLCIANSIPCPESWTKNKCAGDDWFADFMKRHNTLSLKKREAATSLAQAASRNLTDRERPPSQLPDHPQFWPKNPTESSQQYFLFDSEEELNISATQIRDRLKNKNSPFNESDDLPDIATSETAHSTRTQTPRILKLKTKSNYEQQRNQSTDIIKASNVIQTRKRSLENNYVCFSNSPTSSKRQPVRVSNSKDSSINSPSTRVQQITDYMEDEFDIFAKDIAFQLRQLPYYNAVQCQEKIKKIIILAQESPQQEVETIIVKQEPRWSDEEVFQPVSSGQGTILTIAKDELVIKDEEISHPVSSQETIFNQEQAISDVEISYPVSSRETLFNQEQAIRDEISYPVSSRERIQSMEIEEPEIITKEEFSHHLSSH